MTAIDLFNGLSDHDKAFATLMANLGIATKHELDPAEMDVYSAALSDIPLPTLAKAVNKLIRGSKWWPSVADIRTACDEVTARERSAAALPDAYIVPDDRDGEMRTFTMRFADGTSKSMQMRVLPDGHPALPRYHCTACQDSGFEDTKVHHFGNIYPALARCRCYDANPVIARRNAARVTYGETD